MKVVSWQNYLLNLSYPSELMIQSRSSSSDIWMWASKETCGPWIHIFTICYPLYQGTLDNQEIFSSDGGLIQEVASYIEPHLKFKLHKVGLAMHVWKYIQVRIYSTHREMGWWKLKGVRKSAFGCIISYLLQVSPSLLYAAIFWETPPSPLVNKT